MKCSKCGARVSIKDNFCYTCGEPITEEEKERYRKRYEERKKQRQRDLPPIDFSIFDMTPPQGGFGAPPPNRSATATASLKWYRFLINFALFASAALSILNAFTFFSDVAQVCFSYLSGTPFAESLGTLTATQTYEGTLLTYGEFPVLFFLNAAYAMLLLGVAAFAILTRFSLARLKKNSPRLALLYFGVSAGVNVAYQAVVGIITGDIKNPIFICILAMTVLIQTVFITFNHSYFSKRKDIFTK